MTTFLINKDYNESLYQKRLIFQNSLLFKRMNLGSRFKKAKTKTFDVIDAFK